MALKDCPECGREISDKAAQCPHCGFGGQKVISDDQAKVITNPDTRKIVLVYGIGQAVALIPRAAVWIAFFWCARDVLIAQVGQTTIVSYLIDATLDRGEACAWDWVDLVCIVVTLLSAVTAGLTTLAWRRERALGKKARARLQDRNIELEQSIDAGRSSSTLPRSGDTRREDQ